MGAHKQWMIQQENERRDAQNRLLDNVDDLVEANQRIGQLQTELEIANCWRTKLKDHLISWAIGAVIGWILGSVF